MSENKEPYRTMKLNEFKDAVYYQTACDCNNKECNMTLELELDSRFPGFLFLNLYKRLIWNSDYGRFSWLYRMWRRVRDGFRMIFFGYIYVEESHTFRGKEHIKSFISAIEEGMEKIKES